MNKQQSGFTLIELIAVIVILGILAATALPKFVDITSDARIAKLNAAIASMKSAAAMAHGKYLIDPAAVSYVFEGVTVTFVNEYPSAATIAALSGLDPIKEYPSTAASGVMTITLKPNCTASYTEATSAILPPTIVLVDTTGC